MATRLNRYFTVSKPPPPKQKKPMLFIHDTIFVSDVNQSSPLGGNVVEIELGDRGFDFVSVVMCVALIPVLFAVVACCYLFTDGTQVKFNAGF